MQTYEITKDSQSINIILKGIPVPENTQSYLNDFNKAIENINTRDYELHIDGTEYIITPRDMQDTFRRHLMRFKELGFKKVIVKIGDKKVLRLQVCRISKEAGLDNLEII